jgi:hypothetical protein
MDRDLISQLLIALHVLFSLIGWRLLNGVSQRHVALKLGINPASYSLEVHILGELEHLSQLNGSLIHDSG